MQWVRLGPLHRLDPAVPVMARETHDLTVDGVKVGTIETDTGAVSEFQLLLVFDTGYQTELVVTKFDPRFDHTGRIVSCDLEQASLQQGDTQAVSIQWGRVVYSAVYSNSGAFTR